MQEKRVHARAPVHIEVLCEMGERGAVSGIAKDVSLGGMFIEAAETPAFNSQVTIVWQLPGATEPAKLPGIVRWAKPGGFGVQFGLLGARDTHLITRLLKS